MSEPAVVAASPRRRWLIPALVVGCLAILVPVYIGAYTLLSGALARASVRPWAVLCEAAIATKTEPGAEAFYRANSGLAGRYSTSAAFVAASRGWPAKLEGLPKTAPDFWTLIKSGGGNIEVNSSASRSTFTIIGFRGFSARVVHDADRLVDLQIE
jgi:hypothetical protein